MVDPVEAYIIDALREYDPDRIVVFGSRASGDHRPDSDVDILIVKDDPRRPVERMRDVTARLHRPERRAQWRSMPAFEALVFTPAEIAERLSLGDPFFRAMLEGGRTILEKPLDAA